MPSSVTESLRNSSDMHQSADRPTSVYITRLTVAVWPWLLSMLGFLIVVTYWPGLSTWLPKTLGMM